MRCRNAHRMPPNSENISQKCSIHSRSWVYDTRHYFFLSEYPIGAVWIPETKSIQPTQRCHRKIWPQRQNNEWRIHLCGDQKRHVWSATGMIVSTRAAGTNITKTRLHTEQSDPIFLDTCMATNHIYISGRWFRHKGHGKRTRRPPHASTQRTIRNQRRLGWEKNTLD